VGRVIRVGQVWDGKRIRLDGLEAALTRSNGGTAVETKETVQNCKWAEPTLYQDGPYWLDAWNMPWTCRRDGDPRTLEDTDICQNCPRWEARPGQPIAWDLKTTAKS
jgi:hypothetical protein